MTCHALNRGDGRMCIFHAWSGLWRRAPGEFGKDGPVLSPWPLERWRNWTARVNGDLAERQLETLGECVDRGRPFGGEQWVATTAKRLGLEFTWRLIGSWAGGSMKEPPRPTLKARC